MKSVVEQASKFLPPLTAVLLATSVLYDFFFLRSLGLSFSEVPTTIQDHARSALLWLPAAVFIGTLAWMGVVRGLITTLQSKYNQQVMAAWQEVYPTSRRVWTFVVFAVFILLIANSPSMLAFAFFALFFTAPGAWLDAFGVDESKSVITKVLAVFGYGFFAVISLLATYDGDRLLLNEHKWSVGIDTLDGNQMLFASGVRSFSDLTIIVQVSGRVRVVKNADITGMELQEPVAARETTRYSWRFIKYLQDKVFGR